MLPSCLLRPSKYIFAFCYIGLNFCQRSRLFCIVPSFFTHQSLMSNIRDYWFYWVYIKRNLLFCHFSAMHSSDFFSLSQTCSTFLFIFFSTSSSFQPCNSVFLVVHSLIFIQLVGHIPKLVMVSFGDAWPEQVPICRCYFKEPYTDAVRNIYDRVCHSSCEHDGSSSIKHIPECAGRSCLTLSTIPSLVDFIIIHMEKMTLWNKTIAPHLLGQKYPVNNNNNNNL